jgi:hypothetical protein
MLIVLEEEDMIGCVSDSWELVTGITRTPIHLYLKSIFNFSIIIITPDNVNHHQHLLDNIENKSLMSGILVEHKVYKKTSSRSNR